MDIGPIVSGGKSSQAWENPPSMKTNPHAQHNGFQSNIGFGKPKFAPQRGPIAEMFSSQNNIERDFVDLPFNP